MKLKIFKDFFDDNYKTFQEEINQWIDALPPGAVIKDTQVIGTDQFERSPQLQKVGPHIYVYIWYELAPDFKNGRKGLKTAFSESDIG